MEKTLIISTADREAICEAADMLRRIYQGHSTGRGDEDVRAACMALLAIRFEEVPAQGKAS